MNEEELKKYILSQNHDVKSEALGLIITDREILLRNIALDWGDGLDKDSPTLWQDEADAIDIMISGSYMEFNKDDVAYECEKWLQVLWEMSNHNLDKIIQILDECAEIYKE